MVLRTLEMPTLSEARVRRRMWVTPRLGVGSSNIQQKPWEMQVSQWHYSLDSPPCPGAHPVAPLGDLGHAHTGSQTHLG